MNDRATPPSDWPGERIGASAQQPNALPGLLARGLAVLSIIIGGLIGGLVGWALADIECSGDCATWKGVGVVIGAISIAGGVAIVAVLTLRAMDEWQTIKDRPS